MDANTYSDPAVIKLMQSHYIAVKVDQDSRPDLSNRYEDYGWPATIVFDADGDEIVKRQGYIAPDDMASMLQAIIDDPTPGPSVQAARKLTSPGERRSSPRRFAPSSIAELSSPATTTNSAAGAIGIQKFLDWDSVEFAMLLARRDQN